MLTIADVSHGYGKDGERLSTVENCSIDAPDGTFLALVGPSGCGKSTLLKLVAGLLRPQSGRITLDGHAVSRPARERGMVFQQYTLFPWLSVQNNVSFGLDIHGVPKSKKDAIVDHYLSIAGLSAFADAYPKNLSGGMQQRVAIARTLASGPRVLLMDEPFAALDTQTRGQMQDFLTSLWESERKTVLFVTHDVAEAAFLADTVVLLRPRPTSVHSLFRVPFPRPRRHELKRTQEFFDFVRGVTVALESLTPAATSAEIF